MNIWKRAIGFILSIVMVIGITVIVVPSATSLVYAKETISDRMLFDLTSYGILAGNESGDYEFGKEMTRAEFVAVVLRMLRYDKQTSLMTGKRFSDIDGSEWYAPYVNTISELGIVNGYQDGTFRPDEPIQFNEVAKVLVSSLGYSYVAEGNGGFPDGYVFTAQNIGVFKGIDMDGTLTRADVFTAVYNAIDINMMDKVLGSRERYEVINGKTFRNRYTDTSYAENLQRGIGVVSANYNYYISEPVSNIKIDQIQIEGWIYHVGDTNAAEYLGQEVEFYVREERDGTYTIVNIKPTDRNSVIALTEEEYSRFDGMDLYYHDFMGKEKSVKISGNVRYIYNGIPQTNYQNSDIAIDLGELILIDNDDDGIYDIVQRFEYEYVRVKEIHKNRFVFEEGQTLAGVSQIEFDISDENVRHIFVNDEGGSIDIEDIKEGNILSVMMNEYETLYKVVISNKIIEGNVDELTANSSARRVIIDGAEYYVSDKLWRNANVGDKVQAYLNFKGQVIDFEIIEDDVKYGYIVKAADDKLEGVKVHVILPGTLSVEYDIDDSDPENIKKTPYIKGHNSDIVTLKLSSRLAKTAIPIKTPVKYNLNSNGEISRIELAESVGVDGKRIYNGYDRTFGKRNIGAFGTDDTTKIICVPDNKVESIDDYYAMVDMNDSSEYIINGYDVDENGLAKLVVVTMTMSSGSVVGISSNSKIAVVSEIKTVLGDDEVPTLKLSFYSEGMVKSYNIGSAAKTEANKLKFGDVFYYTLNPLNEIGNIRIVGSFENKPEMYNYGNYGDDMTETKMGKVMFGKIQYVKYKRLKDADNKYFDITTIFFDEDGTEKFDLETEYRNPPSIYLVNMRNKTVKVGSRENLIPISKYRDNEYIFVHVVSSKIRGIVLYEY